MLWNDLMQSEIIELILWNLCNILVSVNIVLRYHDAFIQYVQLLKIYEDLVGGALMHS